MPFIVARVGSWELRAGGSYYSLLITYYLITPPHDKNCEQAVQSERV
jgi:hypothetical protein